MRTKRIKRKLRRIAFFTLFFFVFDITPLPYWIPWAPAELYMHIGGKVTDSQTEEAVKGLEVFAIKIDSIIRTAFSGTTSAEGYYSICCVPPGTYKIIIDQQSSYMREPSHKIVTVVRGRNVINADFSLQKGSMISGNVHSFDGSPPKEQTKIFAYALTNTDSLEDITHTELSLDGKYILQGLKPGKVYRVYAGTEKLAFAYKEIAAPAIGQALENIHFTLGNPSTKLTGEVLSNGMEIKDALLLIEGTNTRGIATTDSQGHYAVYGIAPGDYTITVMSDGFQLVTETEIHIINGQETTKNVSLIPLKQTNGELLSKQKRIFSSSRLLPVETFGILHSDAYAQTDAGTLERTFDVVIDYSLLAARFLTFLALAAISVFVATTLKGCGNGDCHFVGSRLNQRSNFSGPANLLTLKQVVCIYDCLINNVTYKSIEALIDYPRDPGIINKEIRKGWDALDDPDVRSEICSKKYGSRPHHTKIGFNPPK